MKRQLFMFVAGGVVCSTSFAGFAAEKIDFAQDVKPILESACLSCHGPESRKAICGWRPKRARLKAGKRSGDRPWQTGR